MNSRQVARLIVDDIIGELVTSHRLTLSEVPLDMVLNFVNNAQTLVEKYQKEGA